MVSKFLLRFNLTRATQAVGVFDARGYVKQKGKENRSSSSKHRVVFLGFFSGVMREILLFIFYLVNQKAPKIIGSTLTWGGTRPAFSKYLIVTKVDILALRTASKIYFKNKSCGGHCLWESLNVYKF